MVKLLHTIVRRWRIDKFRTTDQGSVRRRLADHLAEVTVFEQVPAGLSGAGRWRLAGSTGAPWGGRVGDLVAAAWTVKAVAVRWTDPERRPPIASSSDLTAVLVAVMDAAHGQSLELQQLAEVIVRRFPATLDPQRRSIEDSDSERPGLQLSPEEAWQRGQDAVARSAAAEHIFSQLTPAERAVLPLMADVAAVQRHLGRGRSSAYSYIARLKALVLELAGGHDDAEQIVLEVIDLCADSGHTAVGEDVLQRVLDDPADQPSVAGEAAPSTAGGTP